MKRIIRIMMLITLLAVCVCAAAYADEPATSLGTCNATWYTGLPVETTAGGAYTMESAGYLWFPGEIDFEDTDITWELVWLSGPDQFEAYNDGNELYKGGYFHVSAKPTRQDAEMVEGVSVYTARATYKGKVYEGTMTIQTVNPAPDALPTELILKAYRTNEDGTELGEEIPITDGVLALQTGYSYYINANMNRAFPNYSASQQQLSVSYVGGVSFPWDDWLWQGSPDEENGIYRQNTMRVEASTPGSFQFVPWFNPADTNYAISKPITVSITGEPEYRALVKEQTLDTIQWYTGLNESRYRLQSGVYSYNEISGVSVPEAERDYSNLNIEWELICISGPDNYILEDLSDPQFPRGYFMTQLKLNPEKTPIAGETEYKFRATYNGHVYETKTTIITNIGDPDELPGSLTVKAYRGNEDGNELGEEIPITNGILTVKKGDYFFLNGCPDRYVPNWSVSLHGLNTSADFIGITSAGRWAGPILEDGRIYSINTQLFAAVIPGTHQMDPWMSVMGTNVCVVSDPVAVNVLNANGQTVHQGTISLELKYGENGEDVIQNPDGSVSTPLNHWVNLGLYTTGAQRAELYALDSAYNPADADPLAEAEFICNGKPDGYDFFDMEYVPTEGNDPYTKYLVAVAYYSPNEIAISNCLPVQVEVGENTLDPDRIVYAVDPTRNTYQNDAWQVARDGLLTVEISNRYKDENEEEQEVDADFFGLYIAGEQAGDPWIADSHWVPKSDGDSTRVLLPVSRCEAGQDYEVTVFAIKFGEPRLDAAGSIPIHITNVASDSPIIVSMENEYISGDQVRIYAHYTNPDEIEGEMQVRVWNTARANEILYDERQGFEDFHDDQLYLCSSGNYIIDFLVWQDGEEQTPKESRQFPVTVTSSGQVAQPQISVLEGSNTMIAPTEDEETVPFTITATADPDNNIVFAHDYHIELKRVDWDWTLDEDDADATDGTAVKTYEWDYIQAGGIYLLSIDAFRYGYDMSHNEYLFAAVSGTDTVPVSMTATGLGEDNRIPVNQNVEFRIEKDENEQREIQTVRFFNGRNYWDDDGPDEDGAFTREINFWIDGPHLVFAMVTFDPWLDEYNEMMDDPRVWYTTNVIRVNAERAEPGAQVGQFSISIGDENDDSRVFKRGEFAAVTYTAAVNADCYSVDVNPVDEYGYEDRYYNWHGAEVHDPDGGTGLIPTGELSPGTYRVRGYATGIGYVGSEADNYITITVEARSPEDPEIDFRVAGVNDEGELTIRTGDEIRFSAYAEGAAWINVYYDYANDEGWYDHWNRSDCFADSRQPYRNTGDYTIAARAFYPVYDDQGNQVYDEDAEGHAEPRMMAVVSDSYTVHVCESETMEGLSFYVWNGTELEQVNGQTLEGQYYYKIYVQVPEGTGTFYLGLGRAGSEWAEEGWGESLDSMEQDAHGSYLTLLPSEDDRNTTVLFGSIGENQPTTVTVTFDRNATLESGTELLSFTEANTPVLMQETTLEWTAVAGADAYLLTWTNPLGFPECYYCETNSYTISENTPGGLGVNLGIPGDYQAQITALKDGYAINHPAAGFTAAPISDWTGENALETLNPEVSETVIPQNGAVLVTITNAEGIDYYYADIRDSLGATMPVATSGWAEPQDGETTVLYVPAGALETGRNYYLYVGAVRFGAYFHEPDEPIVVQVRAAQEGDEANLFRVTGLTWDAYERVFTVPAYREFGFYLYTQDAERYELYCDGEKQETWNEFSVSENHWQVGPGRHDIWYEAFGTNDQGESVPLGSAGITVIGLVDEDNPDLQISVEAPAEYIIGGENQEPLNFTVTGLTEAEGGYWEMILSNDGGWGIWSAGSGYGDHIEPDEQGAQTFTMGDTDELQPGLYTLYTEAHAEGKNTYQNYRYILVKDAEAEYETIAVKVNGGTGDLAAPAGTDVHLEITAPGATALRLYNNQGWEPWEFLWEYNGGGYFEKTVTVEEGERTIFVQACYDDVDWEFVDENAQNWNGFSNALTVTGTADGRTAQPDVSVDLEADENNEYVIERGRTLYVIISAPEEEAAEEGGDHGQDQEPETHYGATRFCVTIENEQGDQVSNRFYTDYDRINEYPLIVGMSTGWYHDDGNKYRAVVDAQEPGKGWIRAWGPWFTVSGELTGDENPTIDICAEPDENGVYHVLQGEKVQIMGTAPGAMWVNVMAHNPLDGESSAYDEPLAYREYRDNDEDADPTDFVYNDATECFDHMQPGVYELYASAVYRTGNGTTRRNSDRLTVSVELRDEALAAPEIAIPDGQGGITSVVAPKAPENEDDWLTFTVANLNQEGAEYWEVWVEEEDETEWGDHLTLFRRSSNGWLEQENGKAVFRMSKEKLQAGKNYWIRAKVNGTGYRQQEGSAQFTVSAPAGETPVTISADKTEVEVKEDFEITVAVKKNETSGEPEIPVTAVLMNRGNGQWQPFAVHNGSARIGHRIDEPGIRTIRAKYTTDPRFATEDGGDIDWARVDLDSVTWAGETNILTMTAVSHGTLPEPKATLSNAEWNGEDYTSGYRQGEALLITLGADPTGENLDGHEFWYYADISRGEYDDEWGAWTWSMPTHVDRRGTARSFLIPTYDMEPGRYHISVGMGTQGWQDNRKDFYINIDAAQGEVPDFALIISKDELQTCEETEIILYARGAEQVGIRTSKEGDPNWRDDRDERGSTGRWIWSSGEEGTYTITPYADGQARPENAQTIHVSAEHGRMNDPVIEAPIVLPIGSGLTVTVNATGTVPGEDGAPDTAVAAEDIYLRLTDVSGPEGWFLDDADLVPDENGTASHTFSAERFGHTGVYEVEANSNKPGWNSGHSQARICVIKDEVDESKAVTLTVNGSAASPVDMPSSRMFRVQAQATGAYAIRILSNNEWQYFTGDSADVNWNFAYDTVLIAMASYENPADTYGAGYNEFGENGLWENFRWEDVSWTGLSNTIRVNIHSDGTLGEPDVTLSKYLMKQGEILKAAIGVDPDNTPEGLNVWYFAEISKAENPDNLQDTEWEHRNEWHFDWQDANRMIRIPTLNLEPGTYRVAVCIDGEGIEWNWKEEMITIQAASTLRLPGMLTTLESEAFSGIAAETVMIPRGVTRIEENTFANCPNLIAVYIPDSVEYIHPNAFGNRTQLAVYGRYNSEAAEFAQTKGFEFAGE